MKILLLGKNGQVGWELQRALAPLGELVACDFDSPAPLRADFSRPESLPALVQAVRPDVIVNAAAHTAVDKAETGPLSVYGHTKLAAEQAIAASGCRHLILRTSWVYAARGGNFARTMLRLAAERDQLNVIDDQIGAPTGADLLADVTAHTIRAVQAAPALGGLYHCVAGGETSWHGYARFVIEWARANGQSIRVAPDGVRPIPTAEYPTPAARPLNSRLSTHKLQQAFGLRLPDWQTGVERMLAEVLGR
jgi:dTDP-4-dehydrorhamnose reductase